MSEVILEAVRSKYGSVAASGLSSEQHGVREVAEAFGYSAEDTTILRPPWPIRNRAQARGWARVVLSTPQPPAGRP